MFANLQNLERLEVLSLKLMWYKNIFIYKQHKQAFCILFASVLMFNNDQSAFWFLEECITGALRTYYI